MNSDQKQITNLFLTDDKGEKLVISSSLETRAGGTGSFSATNPKTKETFKITFQIEEVWQT